MQTESIKKVVSEKYGEIARTSGGSCCGPACCGVTPGASMSESYVDQEGYVADADLGLGCGVPTAFADLKSGQTVLDLGSGAGNDAFVARASVGETGHVIGVDMTLDMVEKARSNAARLGQHNVEFRLGEIEHLPVDSNSVDRILSNCVLNLVPDKDAAYKEMFRVLKTGGRFSVSDITMEGEVAPEIREAAALYVGCVAGALPRENMLQSLKAAGFEDVQMPEEKPYPLSVEMIAPLLPEGSDAAALLGKIKVYKVTVTGTKPSKAEGCCTPLATAGACCS